MATIKVTDKENLYFWMLRTGQLHQICTMYLPQRPILDFIKHAIFHSNLLK